MGEEVTGRGGGVGGRGGGGGGVFFFNDTATTEIYTLSLHDALPIWSIKGNHFRINIVPAGQNDTLLWNLFQ